MFKIPRMPALTAGLIMVFLLLAGCSSRLIAPNETGSPSTNPPVSSTIQPVNGRTQSSEGGAVTVGGELVGISGNSLVFRVEMNTHSVDLDRYDLKKLAGLRDDAGNQFQAIAWDAPLGGHHRQGTLSFPAPDTLSQKKAKYVELVIRDVAGVKERVLRWEL